MEVTVVKKEIVVKRLSAFKFSVEVSTNNNQTPVPRVSVIQRAPPAPTEDHAQKEVSTGTINIRYAIMERIVEMLLWKLLGEDRLRSCGYPSASPCQLLKRVVRFSVPNHQSREDIKCKNSMQCYMEHVSKFLQICAPTEEQWQKFGWSNLSEEEILRYIYDKELSPHFRAGDSPDPHMHMLFRDIQRLLQWEFQGTTSVKQQGFHVWNDDTRGIHYQMDSKNTGRREVDGRSKVTGGWTSRGRSWHHSIQKPYRRKAIENSNEGAMLSVNKCTSSTAAPAPRYA